MTCFSHCCRQTTIVFCFVSKTQSHHNRFDTTSNDFLARFKFRLEDSRSQLWVKTSFWVCPFIAHLLYFHCKKKWLKNSKLGHMTIFDDNWIKFAAICGCYARARSGCVRDHVIRDRKSSCQSWLEGTWRKNVKKASSHRSNSLETTMCLPHLRSVDSNKFFITQLLSCNYAGGSMYRKDCACKDEHMFISDSYS